MREGIAIGHEARGYMKVLRTARGVTHRELSALTGIRLATLSNIETGYRLGGYESLERIALALDCPVEGLDVRRFEVEATRTGLTLEVRF